MPNAPTLAIGSCVRWIDVYIRKGAMKQLLKSIVSKEKTHQNRTNFGECRLLHSLLTDFPPRYPVPPHFRQQLRDFPVSIAIVTLACPHKQICVGPANFERTAGTIRYGIVSATVLGRTDAVADSVRAAPDLWPLSLCKFPICFLRFHIFSTFDRTCSRKSI